MIDDRAGPVKRRHRPFGTNESAVRVPELVAVTTDAV